MSFRLCVAGVLAALLVSVAHADSFSKGGTVVVVVGLPGDMESENAYSNEAQRLLTSLNRPDIAPKQVFLLMGGSPEISGQFSYAFTSLPNDRATFRGLVDKLKGAATPCTFIVFGHGGEQGSTPVFHVPGPRLTPDDFQAVAEAVSGSNWLLFFRGSGEFAKALQAQNRTILATEAGDQVFTDDPVSFGFFLTALEKEGDLSRIADATGAATHDWYESRSLARTEEPALWVGTQAPRKLAVAGANEPAAKGDVAADLTAAMLGLPDAPPAVPTPASPPTNGTPQPAGEADPVWQTITPVDAAKYPKDDAVALSRNVSFLIDDNQGISEDEETFLQVLTPAGKKYGDAQFAFSPPDEDLQFLACEVRLPDGTIETVNQDQIHDAMPRAEPDDYAVERKKIFSFPRIEPGAIIRIHLQRTWRRFPLPHVFEDVPLASECPVVAEKVSVSVPQGMAFHFKLLHQPPADPVIAQTNYGSVYTWQFHDQPAVLEEPLSPPEQTPSLAVSTFPDWAAFSNWYIRLIRASDQPTPDLEKQARTLVAGATSDEDKIARVARFVTNFRYVSVPLGVNSFRPHAAVHVWQNRYGDCKDKANLLCTLLTTLGFKTHLVLVPRFSQAYADLPGFAFNHAIATVDLGGKTLWVDTTDDVCRFGLLPPGDPGRNVLVIDDKIDSLTELPLPQAADHQIALETDLRLVDGTARDAEVSIQASTTGYGDYLLRASSEAEGPRPILPLLDRAFTPVSGSFTAAKQDSTTVDDLDAAFTWKAEGTWDGLISQLPQSSAKLVRLPAWVPQEWSVASLPRSNPLHLNQGYPMNIVQTWHIHLPAGAQAVKLPANASDSGAELNWKLAWTPAAHGVTATLDLTLAQADLDAQQTRDFQASCHHLLDVLQDGLTFQTP